MFFFADKLIQVRIPKSVIPEIRLKLSTKINLDEDPIPMKTSLDTICDQLNAKYT